jgi:hypothetical protein
MAYNQIINDEITDLIENDKTSDGMPLIIIDGMPFTWEDVNVFRRFPIKDKDV